MATDAPKTIEGVWTASKLVVLSFPDEAAMRAWTESDAYQEIAKDRRAASDGVVVLAPGLSGT